MGLKRRGFASRAIAVEGQPPDQHAEDYAVAKAIAEGDQVLFREVYDRNAALLYNLARRLVGAEEEAEDIVQETFIRAYQKINLFAGRSSLSSWLYRICINVGLEHIRRQKGVFGDIEEIARIGVEPDQKKLFLRQRLETAIRHLPCRCRAVFIMHDIDGLNHREISERMNLAEGTSKSQLFKARMILRRLLSGKE